MEKEKYLKCKYYSRTKRRCNKTMKYAKLVTNTECVLRIVKAQKIDMSCIDGEPTK